MASKLASPTPTMMMDMGRCEAAMTACLVAIMSDIAPSVNMRRMKYCYNRVGVYGGGDKKCKCSSCTHAGKVVRVNILDEIM